MAPLNAYLTTGSLGITRTLLMFSGEKWCETDRIWSYHIVILLSLRTTFCCMAQMKSQSTYQQTNQQNITKSCTVTIQLPADSPQSWLHRFLRLSLLLQCFGLCLELGLVRLHCQAVCLEDVSTSVDSAVRIPVLRRPVSRTTSM